MLRRVRLKNFKAWEEVDLELGSVTGLFGANSAGKTSLLQFLLLLKQTRNATDRGLVLDFGGTEALVDLGAFEDVLHRHDRRRRLRWTLDWTVSDDLKIADPDRPRSELFRGNLLANRGVVGLRDESPWPYELSYCL
ncbi:MAG: AAA family ATPase, partial [Gammaproteobacteria bacterium]|nr:AAA family ATPase [Gammaproteobacteria bacterium]